MRLRFLTLNQYGNYQSTRIDFSTDPGTINLLQAPNGAGKSVLRAAFGDLLFGIPDRSDLGFRYGLPPMKLEAEVIGGDGAVLAFGRRKKRAPAGLVDAAGEPLSQGLLAGMLGTANRDLLRRLFALDTSLLREGGRALLESDGALGDALLSAAGGIRQVRNLRKSLEEQRDALAPLRLNKQRPFYQALAAMKDATDREREALLRPEVWQNQQAALEELFRKRETALANAAEHGRLITKLERIRRVRHWLAELDTAEGWLAANQDAPRFSAQLRQQIESARQAQILAEARADGAIAASQAAATAAGSVTANTAVLAEADRIDALVREGGAAGTARADLPGVEAEQRAREARIAVLLRQLGSALPVEQAAATTPQRALVTRARRLIQAHAEPAAAARAAPIRIAERTQAMAKVVAALTALPPAAALPSLESLLAEIRADGDPCRRSAAADSALAEAEAALKAALAQVPGWTGDAAALLAIPLPPREVWERLAQARTGASGRDAAARDALAAEQDGLDHARRRLDTLSGAGAVPDEAALAAARAERDVLWRLVYRRAFSPDAPDLDTERSAARDTPLPLAFERAIARADDLADRRAAAADRLAEIEQSRRAVAAAQRMVELRGEQAAAARDALATADQEWAGCCAALTVGAAPALSEVQTWLEARDRVVERVQARALAAHNAAALRSAMADWSVRLAALLAEPTAGLPALLAVADRQLAEGRKRDTERAKLDAAHAQAVQELHRAEAERDTAEQRLAAWRAEWAQVLTALGRPAGEDPDTTDTVLALLDEIGQENQAVASLAERVAGMRRRIVGFATDVRDLAGRIMPALVEADPFECVHDLGRRLTAERHAATRAALLTKQAGDASADAESAALAVREAGLVLRAALERAGAETVDAALVRIAWAAERETAEQRREAALAKLRELGDALPLAALRADAESVPPDEVAPLMDRAVGDRDTANAAARDAGDQATALRLTMEARIGASDVTNAAADRQAAMAAVARTLDEALVLHAAAALLSHALTVVEQGGEAAVLGQISALFSRLTRGAWIKVVTDDSEANVPRLALIARDYPDERVRVEELSEGTRDQLFLALRIAAIEEHARSATPLPFVGDDILQTFDDDRALAALEVLRDLSEHTQVILLTHHRHIMDLAARLPAGAVHVCRL